MSTNQEPTPQIKKSKFDRSDVISIIALITSMAALGATIYEANILKEQQAIMQVQQKSSVWPYVDQTGSRDWSEEDKKLTLTYSVKNKGIGPALIKHISPTLNGEKIETSLNKAIGKIIPEGATYSIIQFSPEGIIGVEEEKVWAKLVVSKLNDPMDMLLDIPIGIDVCYCSIYDDCWIKQNNKEPIIRNCGQN